MFAFIYCTIIIIIILNMHVPKYADTYLVHKGTRSVSLLGHSLWVFFFNAHHAVGEQWQEL